MKSLFERINVGADELREGRVKTASEMLANSSYSYISARKSELLAEINELESHLDLGATSTTDIASTVKDINHNKWVSRLYDPEDGFIIHILTRHERLCARIRTHNSLFPDLKIEEPDLGMCGGLLGIIVGKEEKSTGKKKAVKETKTE